MYDVSVDVSQAIVTSLMAIGQLLLVDSEKVQVRRLLVYVCLPIARLMSDEIHLVQIEDLLLGTYIEFKAGIHFSFSVVRIELCVSTRLFANL